MNPADRHLAALAALFAPDRAGALLARLATADGAGACAAAEALARAPRRDRLAALEGLVDRAVVEGRGAAAERPRVAEVIRAVARGAADEARDGGAAPLVLRLCLERVAFGAP